MQYVAFLRGINVGGRRVRGEQLCTPFEMLGFQDAASLLASGNVTFSTEDADDLELRISEALRAALGYEVDTFVRSAETVATIARHEPFPAEVVTASVGRLHITFLHRAPNLEAIKAAGLTVAGTEWYWLSVPGMSYSAGDVRAIERLLGRGTTRTHDTVARLATRLQPELPA